MAKLRRIKLVGTASANDPNTLDAHPLVREHFRQQLKRERPDTWREANNRLYEHLAGTARELPNTVEEMSPLYAAVAHGCAAGRHQEVLEEVYIWRIQRGSDHFFNWNILGAYGADLAALSSFFKIVWTQPVAGLTDAGKGYVLNSAGVDLQALGRLEEAAQPMQAGLEAALASEDWKNAAKSAGNVSRLYLTIGDVAQALKFSRLRVELAERSGDVLEQMLSGPVLYDALHQAGRKEEAAAGFREAEVIQKQIYPNRPLLYGLDGFNYCDLLLGQGQVQEVKERATRTLEWVRPKNWLLNIALDNLSLGRAWLLETQQSGAGDTGQAAEFLQRAVTGLRQASHQEFIARGLLARAELHRFKGEHERAERDLDEVLRIATRGGMGLYLADYHLESARLHLAQGNQDKAREHLATAREMIERMGYHRRDNEVNEIAERLR